MTAAPDYNGGRVEERWTRSNPCPICGGAQSDPRGKGVRCCGYRGSGGYVHCSREEFAGTMQPHKGGTTFAHRLNKSCHCGVQHGGPAPPDVQRVTSIRTDAPKPWRIPDADVEMIHRYQIDGVTQFEVCRLCKHARPKHLGAKVFPRHRGDDGAWYFGQGPRWKGRADKPLYRQDEALAELRVGGSIFIVEGERDADALWDRGCIGVCNPDGAGSFRPAQAQRLIEAMFLSAPPIVNGERVTAPDVLNAASAEIMIIADDDPDGLQHATMIRETLIEVEPRLKDRVRVFLPPSGFKDAAEWLAMGAA